MIAIACDHGGLNIKNAVMKHLDELGLEYKDYGTYTTESVDYPDYAAKVCNAIISGEADRGILVCGTGIGMSLAANSFKGIRAALCGDCFSAEYTRRHNDANVLCMGERVIGAGLALEITDKFLNTGFEGGRHQKRLDKLAMLKGEK